MIFRKKIMDQNQLIDQLFGQKIDFSNFSTFLTILKIRIEVFEDMWLQSMIFGENQHKKFFHNQGVFREKIVLHPLSELTHFSYDPSTTNYFLRDENQTKTSSDCTLKIARIVGIFRSPSLLSKMTDSYPK